jgi:putative phage-type endonuclease
MCSICQSLEAAPESITQMIMQQKMTDDQRVDDWYEQRRYVITASEIGSLLGHNFYKSAEDVISAKTNAIVYKDKCGNAIHSDAIDWGVKYETEALDAFMKATGHKVIQTGLLRHKDKPIIAASPDGITYCGRTVEIKCPYSKISKTLRQVPKHYEDQVMAQMAVTGLTQAYFVQFRPRGYGDMGQKIAGQPQTLMYITVDYDSEWLEKAYPILECAHNDITRRVETHDKPILFDLDS